MKIETSVNATGYDGIIFISHAKPGTEGPEEISSALAQAVKVMHFIDRIMFSFCSIFKYSVLTDR